MSAFPSRVSGGLEAAGGEVEARTSGGQRVKAEGDSQGESRGYRRRVRVKA